MRVFLFFFSFVSIFLQHIVGGGYLLEGGAWQNVANARRHFHTCIERPESNEGGVILLFTAHGKRADGASSPPPSLLVGPIPGVSGIESGLCERDNGHRLSLSMVEMAPALAATSHAHKRATLLCTMRRDNFAFPVLHAHFRSKDHIEASDGTICSVKSCPMAFSAPD
jgi:hypothetical protein